VGYTVSYTVGCTVSYTVGYTVSYTVGYTVTYTVGYTVSYTVGYTVGYTVSYTVGYTVSYTSIRPIIRIYIELGILICYLAERPNLEYTNFLTLHQGKNDVIRKEILQIRQPLFSN